jgi:hypothetical protein
MAYLIEKVSLALEYTPNIYENAGGGTTVKFI